jgi:phytoene dehydrogenase-like protein
LPVVMLRKVWKTNTPCINERPEITTDELRKNILDKIKRSTGYDISGKIISEKVMTRNDIESQTGSYKGSIYGISSNSRKAAFMRQANKSAHYKGLYFCGGSAHPGGGIPLVLLSGKLCSESLIKSLKSGINRN